MSATTDRLRVLHVDDEPDFADTAATFLEREDDRLTVTTATSASDGLDVLATHEIDCIVSDYDMPGTSGIEFLETVRESYPDLPFILFTGKGSEEVASEAISAGVTDYLQKTGTPDQYAVLANRITNLVGKYQAERAQERYRVLVEEATDAILVVGPDATIQYATPSAEAILGRTPEELVGTSGFEPIHPDDRDRVMEEFAALAAQPGARRTVEFRYERPDGSWIWAEARGRNLLESSAIDGIAVYTRDITERRERVEELREEKALTEATLESVAEFYWSIDLDGYVTRWSDTDGEVTGYTEAEAIGRHSSTFHPDEHVPRIEQAIERVRTEGAVSVEADLLTKAGERIPYHFTGTTLTDEDGTVRAICGLGQDISERKERQRELERYEAIVENTEDGVYVFDAQGRFEFVNQRVADVSGIPQAAWVGEHVSIHTDLGTLTEREVAAIEEGIEAIVHGDADEVRVELTPDIPHELRVLDLRLTAFTDAPGDDRVIGFSRDITEQKQYEAELERRNDRLDEFAAVISHDLRNPLNVAQGHLQLVEEECDSDHLDAVVRSHDRMEMLIDSLLTLARSGEQLGDLEPVSLATLTETCWENVSTAEATLVTATDRTIQADRTRLQQLLENLIRNGVDHGGDGVTVTVGALEDGFYVEDDGPGIPAGEREQVFDAGYSTTGDGTGLGLAIVEEIVDAHGWTIDVTDGDDGGARFEITGVEVAEG